MIEIKQNSGKSFMQMHGDADQLMAEAAFIIKRFRDTFKAHGCGETFDHILRDADSTLYDDDVNLYDGAISIDDHKDPAEAIKEIQQLLDELGEGKA